MAHLVQEVDPIAYADVIRQFNSLDPIFPELQPRHFTDGYWWIAFSDDGETRGFAGLVPMTPFDKTGYLKRCLTLDRGYGIQYRMMIARELKAKQLGWTRLVSECRSDNEYSCRNFRKAGFERFEPEQPWGEPGSIFWTKIL